MRAETTEDGRFIQIVEYTDFERQQLETSFNKQVANWRFIKKNYPGWDGYVCFIDNYMRIPIGLWRRLELICEKFDMDLEWGRLDGVENKNIDDDHFLKWVKEAFKDAKKKPRDYQIEGILSIIKYPKSRSEIATNAGKTLMIFTIYQYLKLIGELDGKKMMIVVPNTNLIIQTDEEFEEFSESIGVKPPIIQLMHGGKIKEKMNADIILGTFQTLTKLGADFFDDVNVVCIDEAHHTNAKSVKSIIQKAFHANYRFGVSGTLPNTDDANSFTLDAYLGPEVNNISAKFLIDSGFATKMHINMFMLKYEGYDAIEEFYKLRASDMAKEGAKLLALERSYVVSNKQRFEFVVNLINKTTKNSLVLFTDVKNGYGKNLYKWLNEYASDKRVLYVDGSTSSDHRKEYIDMMDEDNKDSGLVTILVASFGTFAQGISINNIHNIFFTESYKSDRIIKQSIGRGMRLLEDKEFVNIIDIVDDLSVRSSQRGKNYLLRQGEHRMGIYKSEGHVVKKFNVTLKKKGTDSLF